MTAGPAALRRAQAPARTIEPGASVARPSFHRPANDNRMPWTKLLVEWSAVLAIGMFAAALVWWLVF